MKIVGVICEYNPLHTGHLYHLEQARKECGGVIAVMSGDFVQRGEPALCDKYARAEMALRGGADAVIELPPACATGSAEVFARGAVRILDACGCVSELCFGAECDDIEKLRRAASLSGNEAFPALLQEGLRQGLSYAAASAGAAEALDPESAAVLGGSNNILAVEYLKALKESGSRIKARAVLRKDAAYGTEKLPEGGFASAAAIRKALQAGKKTEELSAFLPSYVRKALQVPIFPNDLSASLSAVLLRLIRDGEDLSRYADVSRDLAARIRVQAPFTLPFEELADRIQTRTFTLSRVRRALLHILLGIRNEDQNRPPRALKLLGMRPDSEVLKALKEKAALPLISKAADHEAVIREEYGFARSVYMQAAASSKGLDLPDDFRRSPVVWRPAGSESKRT